ncbi:MAG: SGNH/GDSL hydrolase family protein [Planctomycetaceae bacterium]
MTSTLPKPRTAAVVSGFAFRRRWMFRAVSFVIAMMAALLLAEVALRLFVADTRSPYIYDQFTGTRLRPGHRFVFQSEGFSSNVINSRGLRDREHFLEKPAGTLRIAILGDSFSEAFQVSQDKTFWSVLERELQAMPEHRDQTVEVINFGVSGFGTIQEWQMLEHYVRDYSPDLVLLAFLPGNDVRNNSRQLEPDHRRPFAWLKDGELQLDVSFRDDPMEKRFRELTWSACKDQAIRRSRVVHLIYRALEDWRARKTLTTGSQAKTPAQPSDPPNEDDAASLIADEEGIDNAVFAPPTNAAWIEAWQITDRVLEAIQKDSLAMGAKFVVVILNNSVEVHPDPEVTASLAMKLGVSDLEEPQRQLIASGNRYSFPVIRLLERMRHIARRDQVCFHGFPNTSPCTGHWNELGHETAGKLIAKDLSELLQD